MADDSLTPDKTNTNGKEQHPSGNGEEPDSKANLAMELEMEDRTPSELPAGSSAGTIEETPGEEQVPALPYPVVGFGASAGGLQAFRQVLENLDPNTGMTFVLVMHLAPDQKSFPEPMATVRSGLRRSRQRAASPSSRARNRLRTPGCREVPLQRIMSTW